ncbi:uncharacterized protein CLUP02_18302 [Colletotrichum lupini]|uniref:Rhodanese domain-containing protein n=3 Tax=Colletotrichum acutatum species complex TaxID=2707335 RepID=A0A9Q8SHV8_9PEZI|nr:uncharacterized protein CLUP02_18302 [Colletotrichum lupini]UQC76787.1 hypothetical protein CLUP02_18302 [Colletotrichum lupini]
MILTAINLGMQRENKTTEERFWPRISGRRLVHNDSGSEAAFQTSAEAEMAGGPGNQVPGNNLVDRHALYQSLRDPKPSKMGQHEEKAETEDASHIIVEKLLAWALDLGMGLSTGATDLSVANVEVPYVFSRRILTLRILAPRAHRSSPPKLKAVAINFKKVPTSLCYFSRLAGRRLSIFSRFLHRPRTMATIGTLQRISAAKLSALLLAEQAAGTSSVAVVDVREDDYLGGHIKGCINMPSRSLDATMPTLMRRLEGKKTVVFHCALSQQRGPSAALRYLRERDQNLASNTTATDSAGDSASAEPQTVYVLDRGFVGWQEKYGEDERLTEGYSKELWKDGYWM